MRISGKTYVTARATDYVTLSRGNNHFYCSSQLVTESRPRNWGTALNLKSWQNVNKLLATTKKQKELGFTRMQLRLQRTNLYVQLLRASVAG